MGRYAQIEGDQVVNILELDDKTAQDFIASGIALADAPDYVEIGWTINAEGDRYTPLNKEGWAFDPVNSIYYSHAEYRRILHERTTNDVLQAQRKLREGDASIDWQAWLDALDAYNLAVENTKTQESYPDRVVYPDYPSKPKSTENAS